MICLRCGCCCIDLDVAIVNPGSIRPDGTILATDRGSIVFKPAGERCPHLLLQGDVAICSIHELPCYTGSPCQQFEQLGREDDVCIMGRYLASENRREREIP